MDFVVKDIRLQAGIRVLREEGGSVLCVCEVSGQRKREKPSNKKPRVRVEKLAREDGQTSLTLADVRYMPQVPDRHRAKSRCP